MRTGLHISNFTWPDGVAGAGFQRLGGTGRPMVGGDEIVPALEAL